MSNRRAGFTLIELSIVIVIIGLLIGGVMVGRVMIRSSELHRAMSVKAELQNAINLFQNRYQQWPGDFPNFDGELPGADGGNGNGIVAYMDSAPGLWQEVNNVYVHLSKVRLLGEDKNYSEADLHLSAGNFSWVPGTDAPPGPLPGTVFFIGAFDVDTYGRLALSRNTITLTGLDIRNGAMKLEDALELDTKFDDGKASQGDVRSYRPWGTPGGNNCVSAVRTAASANYLSAQANTSLGDCIVELGTF